MVYINYLAVLIAAIAQFIIGGVWYMPIFGKLWGKMHGFDTLAPEVQERMRKGMWPFLILQFVMTLVTTVVYALLLNGIDSTWNAYGLAFFFWLGFVLPAQVSAVVFGGTPPQWIVKKIAIMAGGSLICLEVLALVLKVMH